MTISRRDFLVLTGTVGAGLVSLPSLPPLSSVPSLPPLPLDTDSGLTWRLLGPFRGGRVDAVTGIPGRPHEFYFGAVNGGVWKTIDGGRVWKPVFDSQPIASIGAIAVAPSAPDVLYVGSGESTLRDSVGYGNGMYKSTDSGKTWTHVGLDDTQHIGKIAVDPTNPDIVFVAAIGHLYAANPDRGVFRSKDGGKSWQKVLFKNEDVGAVEVVIDPTNPQVVYAGLWNTRRPPWFTYAPTNGPGGGLYKSTDGGDTWKQLTTGLPSDGIGRTGIAVAPSHSQRVYAVVDCLVPEPGATVQAPAPGSFGRDRTPRQGGFFRSDDAGATWTRLSADPALWGRGWYFEKLVVDPTDPDVVYVPNVAVSRSMDGGKTWVVIRGSPGGDDYHQAWISREDPNTMVLASDQGCIITRNAKSPDPRDVTWSSWLNQPTAQVYHVSVDYRFPYWVTGAQQDSGAVAVCSRGKFAEITTRDWEPIGAGGESGYTAGDPLHPGIVYGGTGSRFNLELNRFVPGTASPVVPQGSTARGDWTQPLVLSPADPHALYYANQFLFKSTDGAKTWKMISQDLTRPDPGAPPSLDAAAAAQVDRNGKRGVIYTIAPSPRSAPLIWIGTDDGLIQLTPDDGKTWRDVTPAGLTPWSRVTMLEASRHDPNVAYASVDRHQLQDFDPYIYRTRDMGKTWQRITSGLPAGVYVHVIKEDPVRQGLLFAGTERGAFLSLDDGEHWQPLQLNLPVTSVRDFQVYGNDLIVATHGRGFWVIDDISALRDVTDAVLAEDAHLFKPADAVNVVQDGDEGTPYQRDEPWTDNAPDGAIIAYYLKAAASGPVTIDILDQKGATIATLSSVVQRTAADSAAASGIPNVSPLWRPAPKPLATTAGIHRAVWRPVLRSGEFRQPTLLTGTFTAKLTVNGQSYAQPFTVKPDPRNPER
ncbi:MAG TPA: glycosyl hydrolase [Gemmatimonadales bacterium]